MSTGSEARVSLDVYGTGIALSEQFNPLIGFTRGLAYGKNLFDQRSRDLESVFDCFGVWEANGIDPSNGNVSLKLERRHSLTHTQDQQVLMQ
jgi:hypothetical protein